MTTTKRLSGNVLNPWVSKEKAVKLLEIIDSEIKKDNWISEDVSFGKPENISIDVYEKYSGDAFISSIHRDAFIVIPRREAQETFRIVGADDIDLYEGIEDKNSYNIDVLEKHIKKIGDKIQPADILLNLHPRRDSSLQFHYKFPFFRKHYYNYNSDGLKFEMYDFSTNPELIISVFQYQAYNFWKSTNKLETNLYDKIFLYVHGEGDVDAIYTTANINPDMIGVERGSGYSTHHLNRLKQDKIHRRHAKRIEGVLLNHLKNEINKELRRSK